MKKNIYILSVILVLSGIYIKSIAQLEVKGSGTTGYTLILKNSASDTSMVVLDNGRIGLDTSNPQYPVDVKGLIFARSGILYPDGLIQTTAWAGNISYKNVFTVAKSGGDYDSITAALRACISPSRTNQYLIRVMPGNYTEPPIQCKKHVHLIGAGKYSSTIISQVKGEDSCVIENFFITKGIKCTGKSPTIIHNIITNSDTSYHGIRISGMGQPWIKENEIVDCDGWGILCENFHSDPWIIGNKILRNDSGGIKCIMSSPIISNNYFDYNKKFGIYMIGTLGDPTEPTIDDNQIFHTDFDGNGIGIYMIGYAEPRIMSNDIAINECGIWIDNSTQPSIIGNDINYNNHAGIRCFSKGASKRVVITGNHLHSNTVAPGGPGLFQWAGIWVQNANPMITLNNITQNDRSGMGRPDIDYSLCLGGGVNIPSISLNVYDLILKSIPAAGGNYNVDAQGNPINP